MSEAYWMIPDEPSGLPEDVVAAKARRDEAWERFHTRCMEWYEVYEEVHGYSGLEI